MDSPRSRLMTGGGLQPIPIAIALTAACTFAVANVVQQRVAAKLRSDAAFEPGVLLKLVRRPLWLAGLVLVIVSLSLQATALDLGRLVVIEPVLASSLLFALGLASWADRRRMRAAEWLAAFATFAGLAVFLSVAQPSGGRPTASQAQLGVAAIAAVAIAAAAGLLARRMSPLRRALTLGVGGGIAAGVTDALTKTVAALVGARQIGAVADVRIYLLVVIGLLTYTMQQNGYRAASLAAFLPAFSVLDPAVGSLLGLVLYHERLAGGPARIAAEVAAALAATWGIARLARSTAEAEVDAETRTDVPEAEPVRLDPVLLAGPVLADPVLASPVLANPLLADALLADALLADPVLADPVLADPVLADPVLADPVLADPVLADPVLADPLLAAGAVAAVADETPAPSAPL